MPPSVSVVIPAWNAGMTLREAVHSAWSQTVPPLEIVLANDASDDDTSEVGRAVGCKVLDLPKGNGAIARNRGAQVAKGERLFFLDADDRWLPTKIEAHLNAAMEQPLELILDRAAPFVENGQPPQWVAGRSKPGPHAYSELIDHRSWVTGSGFSVTPQAYWSVGGFNEALTKFQDVDFWIRCAARNLGWFQIDSALTEYRISAQSVSKSTARHQENLAAMLNGWDFASDKEKQKMRQLAYLMMAEQSTIPKALVYLAQAAGTMGNRFFWKCLYVSIKRTISQGRA